MTDDAQRPAGRRPAPLVLVLVLLAVGATDWRGYRFGGSNQSLQVPWLRHLADASLYSGDPVLGSFDGYASFFFHGLAPVVRAVGDVEPVYFVLFLLAHAAALGALIFLGRTLTGSTAAGWIACFLYLGTVPSLGAEFTYWPRLTHAHVANASLLWALAFQAAGRTRLAWILCGATFNIHALYAAHVAVMLAADSLVRRREHGMRRLALDAALFLALAAPTVAWILGRNDPVLAADWPAWLETMRERSGLHTFPSTAPAGVFGRYLLLLAGFGLAWGAVRAEERHRAVIPMAAAVLGLCILGLLGSEIVPVRRIIEAQLFRSTRWLTVLALVYVARLVMQSWRWEGWGRAVAVALAAGLILQQPAWLALGLALCFAVPSRLPLASLATVAVALVVAAFTGAAPLPDRMGLLQLSQALEGLLERPGAIACLAGFGLMRAAALGSERRRLPAAIAVVAVLVALPAMWTRHRAAVRGEPWNDVQLWVEHHTPRAAVLLTPPAREGFRVFSERAIVGEWKDGTQQFFSWRFTREWKRRMADVGGGDPALYDGLTAEDLGRIAGAYGAGYAVTAAAAVYPFERVYENDEFAVYRLPAGSAVP